MTVARRVLLVILVLAFLAATVLSGSEASATGTRWTAAHCESVAKAWRRTHRHASRAASAAVESRLAHTHLCVFGTPAHVALPGLGASEAAWAGAHPADPEVLGGYEPMPGAFPGSLAEDRFTVTFADGKVESYFQRFSTGASQAMASAAVGELIPTDAKLLVAAEDVGTCAVEEFRSHAYAAASGGKGVILVTYASAYGPGESSYDRADVLEAFVDGAAGGPIGAKGLRLANGAVCG